MNQWKIRIFPNMSLSKGHFQNFCVRIALKLIQRWVCESSTQQVQHYSFGKGLLKHLFIHKGVLKLGLKLPYTTHIKDELGSRKLNSTSSALFIRKGKSVKCFSECQWKKTYFISIGRDTPWHIIRKMCLLSFIIEFEY